MSSCDYILDLILKAQIEDDVNNKRNYLIEAQELIFTEDSKEMILCVEEILEMSGDPQIKDYILDFIENLNSKYPLLLHGMIPSLKTLISDYSPDIAYKSLNKLVLILSISKENSSFLTRESKNELIAVNSWILSDLLLNAPNESFLFQVVKYVQSVCLIGFNVVVPTVDKAEAVIKSLAGLLFNKYFEMKTNVITCVLTTIIQITFKYSSLLEPTLILLYKFTDEFLKFNEPSSLCYVSYFNILKPCIISLISRRKSNELDKHFGDLLLRCGLNIDDIHKILNNSYKRRNACKTSSSPKIVKTEETNQEIPLDFCKNEPQVTKMHVLKLSDKELKEQCFSALSRILSSKSFGHFSAEDKLHIACRVSILHGSDFRAVLLKYILDDVRNNGDLAITWLYHEYTGKYGTDSYDECLTGLLYSLFMREEKKEGLFSRILLECPLITENALKIMGLYCQDENRAFMGISTVKDVILKRPGIRPQCLDYLLQFSFSLNNTVRMNSIFVLKSLKDHKTFFNEKILNFASDKFNCLTRDLPFESEQEAKDFGVDENVWSDALQVCFSALFFSILPENPDLLNNLVNVFVLAGDKKSFLLKQVDTVIKTLGISCPQVLQILKNHPTGASMLIIRIICVLGAEDAEISGPFIDAVLKSYRHHNCDIRFLIPVISWLDKDDVLNVLPRILSLPTTVVHKVLMKIVSHRRSDSSTSPSDLFIALHFIQNDSCSLKNVIEACDWCISNSKVFTETVLVFCLQHLITYDVLPSILMRTVIRCHITHPSLLGFVINYMQQLITKQVWKDNSLWKGFIKCCKRTRPQSMAVLLQLPHDYFSDVIKTENELARSLKIYISQMTKSQKSRIPSSMIKIVDQVYAKMEYGEDFDLNEFESKEEARNTDLLVNDGVQIETIGGDDIPFDFADGDNTFTESFSDLFDV